MPLYGKLQLHPVQAIAFLAITATNPMTVFTGLVKRDPYVTTPNALGVVVAVFCALTAHGLADDKVSAVTVIVVVNATQDSTSSLIAA
jgi:hypothetical protein